MIGRPGCRQVLGVVLCVAFVACNSPRLGYQTNELLSDAVESARAHTAGGRVTEAWQLLEAVGRVDPDYSSLEELRSGIPRSESLVERRLLGSNLSHRRPVSATVLARALWYLPDRLLDAFDIVSFDGHVGVGAYTDIHVTRAAQISLGYRAIAGLGWHDHRSLGVLTKAEVAANFLSWGAGTHAGYMAGTSGLLGFQVSMAGLQSPSGEFYQEYLDFWAVGVSVTVALVGVEFDLHPLELADFLAGIFTVDFLQDDFATTEGTELQPEDWEVIRALMDVASSEVQLQNYEHWRDTYGMP